MVDDNSQTQPDPPPRELQINLGSGRRWRGMLAYIILVLLAGTLFVLLFSRFTGQLWLAIALVGFLLGYMLIMGFLASRNMHDRWH